MILLTVAFGFIGIAFVFLLNKIPSTFKPGFVVSSISLGLSFAIRKPGISSYKQNNMYRLLERTYKRLRGGNNNGRK